MKARLALILTLCFAPRATVGQSPDVISLASEPHHHLALHNEYVNVYEVELASHGTVQLHRHEFDAISIMMSNSEVIVRVPNKPDVRQRLSEGQVRLQSRGYVHSTSIEGANIYRNVTVELLSPQDGARNLCASVIAGQPLNCPDTQLASPGAPYVVQAQFETNQTRVALIHLLPHQSIHLGDGSRPVLVIALDAVLSALSAQHPTGLVRPGEFMWLEKGAPAGAFENTAEKEARLISFTFER